VTARLVADPPSKIGVDVGRVADDRLQDANVKARIKVVVIVMTGDEFIGSILHIVLPK
jgi:hypothetical protein